jgi:hypothetical protein
MVNWQSSVKELNDLWSLTIENWSFAIEVVEVINHLPLTIGH